MQTSTSTREKAAIEGLAKTSPDLYQRFFKKRVDFHHPNFTGMKSIQLSLAAHLLLPSEAIIDMAWTCAAIKMEQFGLPVYYLTKAFAEAVDATMPPADLRATELQMPFGAFAVTLPRDFSRSLFGTVISHVILAKVYNNESLHTGEPLKINYVNVEDKFLTLAICPDTTEGLPIHYGTVNRMNVTFETMFKDENLSVFQNPLVEYPEFDNTVLSKADEATLPRKLGLWAFKLLAVLNACPDLIEEQVQAGKLRGSRKVATAAGSVEYFQAQWIGVNYKEKSERPHEGPPGTHASPRMHWRRGHIRRLQSTRMIWIQPVLVNVNKPKV